MLFERQLADILSKEPPRDYAVQRCVDAWDSLGTERPVGFAVGAIPVSKIWKWCDRRGLDLETADVVEHVIRTLDVERAIAAAKDKEIDDATGKGRRGARR